MEKTAHKSDPRGLIFESYRIDGIRIEECRSIFLDWALGLAMGDDVAAHIDAMLAAYGDDNPDHPMTQVMREGAARRDVPKGRRGGRKARI